MIAGEPGTDPLPRLIQRLEQLGKHGRGGNWQCPAHEDSRPSLRVIRSRKGGVTLYCHAGCQMPAILAALDWRWQDLYPPEHQKWAASPRPDIDELQRRYNAGQLRPRPISLGRMPTDATVDMQRMAEDIQILLGLNASVGEYRPMPYSTRFAATRMGWRNGHVRANKAIRALVTGRVISRGADLPPRRGHRGTATYMPPLPVQEPAVTVEAPEVEPASELVDYSGVLAAETAGWEHIALVTARY